MKKIRHAAKHAAKRAKMAEPSFRALLVYVLAAVTSACMARAMWSGGDPGVCCDNFTMQGTAQADPRTTTTHEGR